MKKTIMLAMGLLFASGCSYLHQQVATWTWKDTAMVVAGEAATAVDWRQTAGIAADPLHFKETNIVLGPHPSMASVNRYFPPILVGIPLAHLLMPSDLRPYLAGFYLGAEGSRDAVNFRSGVTFK